MRKLIAATSLLLLSSAVLADNVIVTETKTWKSVPIEVQPNTQVYTVQGTVPTEGEYYYTYSGYRCLSTRKEVEGVKPVVLHGANGGAEIYCYPES